MRTEAEMMALILGRAGRDSRVRAVALNGSRVNPNVPKDIFQDYDVVYVVSKLESFRAEPDWVDLFGGRLILQIPDNPGGRITYLMQLADGNRIDLTLVPLAEAEQYAREDKLTMVLLDKDNCMPQLPPATDRDYWVQPPTAQAFDECCNEFWWVAPYVAKGLWRREFLYAQAHLADREYGVTTMLLKMLSWQVGLETNFSLSVGKCGKYLERYLPAEVWRQLQSTYERGNYAQLWRALFVTTELFRAAGQAVAARCGYDYPRADDQRVTAFLKRISELPADAAEIW